MKTIPGIVGPALLVVATSLVTWFTVTHSKSGHTFANYDKLDNGFYSTVIKGRVITKQQSDDLKARLADLKKSGKPDQLAFCFVYNPGTTDGWSDSYPGDKKCPKEDSPTSGTEDNNMNWSVLSHKIYSIRACDIELISDAIK